MDEYEQNEEQTQSQSTQPSEGGKLRSELEAQIAKNAELATQVQSMQREGVLRDAGLQLSDKQRRALEATHEGDWTADLLKATAKELNFLTDPSSTQTAPPPAQPNQPNLDQPLSSDELDSISRMREFAAGPSGGANPTDAFMSDLDSAVNKAIVDGDENAMRDYLQSTGWGEGVRNRQRSS
mgnify:CR=1 FL=1